ncbi:MAG TPA: hypothetical protein VEO54_26455 [Thermoanaerobaculia bacterium]|nr:hypothetical protein [Thermoanaerobaculia bacterium]
MPDSIEVKEPEGYAFYAVYPELYVKAAEAVRHLASSWTVIGIRSIGTSLGAAVAAALPNARFVTVRPTGHPYARELHPSPYEESVLAQPAGAYAIVDEGPGLSGSSFAAVAQWLERRGVPRGRMVFFPSHAGEPGRMASEETRALWRDIRKSFVDFQSLGLFEGARELHGGSRRKYRLDDRLAKFNGLGVRGDEMYARACELAEAGFAPPVTGRHRGFLLTRWLEQSHPVHVLPSTVARYLAFRNDEWPATRGGASAQQLAEMARFNAGLDLSAYVTEVEDTARRVVTDNKLHAEEWIAAPDGTILKCDGVDHHAAHDLIGCQDLAWDLAGARVELGLDVTDSVARMTGRSWSPRVLHFYTVCYRAFWYGFHTLHGNTEAAARYT